MAVESTIIKQYFMNIVGICCVTALGCDTAGHGSNNEIEAGVDKSVSVAGAGVAVGGANAGIIGNGNIQGDGNIGQLHQKNEVVDNSKVVNNNHQNIYQTINKAEKILLEAAKEAERSAEVSPEAPTSDVDAVHEAEGEKEEATEAVPEAATRGAPNRRQLEGVWNCKYSSQYTTIIFTEMGRVTMTRKPSKVEQLKAWNDATYEFVSERTMKVGDSSAQVELSADEQKLRLIVAGYIFSCTKSTFE